MYVVDCIPSYRHAPKISPFRNASGLERTMLGKEKPRLPSEESTWGQSRTPIAGQRGSLHASTWGERCQVNPTDNSTSFIRDDDVLTPISKLVVVDLAEVQHGSLHHLATSATFVLNDAPIAMCFAVFEALGESQEHANQISS